MKLPRLFISSLILALTLLGSGTVLAQEKTGLKETEAIALYEKAIKGDAKALAELRGRAEKGDARAQFNLGLMYQNGQGVAKDEVEAVKWYRKAADQGNAFAQNNLGVMYANGLGVEEDDVEAYKWFLLSGAQGTEQAKEKIPIIEKSLTPEQRAQGEKLAREFKKK